MINLAFISRVSYTIGGYNPKIPPYGIRRGGCFVSAVNNNMEIIEVCLEEQISM